MFTGIVEEMGQIRQTRIDSQGMVLEIEAHKVLEGTQLGDSIAVNGTCLTVTGLSSGTFTTGVSPETRSRTNLQNAAKGHRVNLERACTPNTRLGGHLVQGHVDGVGTLVDRRQDQEALWLTIEVNESLTPYIVDKGFICLDGASLTVVEARGNRFTVMLVPFTQTHIVFPQRRVGDAINVEVDIIGKYVEKMLKGHLQRPKHGISMEDLESHGFLS